MRVLVLGCGLAGSEVATGLVADGHEVVATTTTPARVESLQKIATEVRVLRGSDRELVHAAIEGCDAIVVTAGPAAQRAMSREERAATYHDVLVATAENVTSAPSSAPIVALSSLSLYGTAADHLSVVTEEAPVSGSDDPSPSNMLAMEAIYRAAGDRACIFRCADIFGGEDPPIEAKIRMAHEILKGSIPFRAEALFYRVHVSDVAAAIRHAIDARLTGTYNLTHAEVPPTNGALFDAVSANLGFPPLVYRDELEGAAVPISIAALTATGFTLKHTVAPTMPEA